LLNGKYVQPPGQVGRAADAREVDRPSPTVLPSGPMSSAPMTSSCVPFRKPTHTHSEPLFVSAFESQPLVPALPGRHGWVSATNPSGKTTGSPSSGGADVSSGDGSGLGSVVGIRARRLGRLHGRDRGGDRALADARIAAEDPCQRRSAEERQEAERQEAEDREGSGAGSAPLIIVLPRVVLGVVRVGVVVRRIIEAIGAGPPLRGWDGCRRRDGRGTGGRPVVIVARDVAAHGLVARRLGELGSRRGPESRSRGSLVEVVTVRLLASRDGRARLSSGSGS
jgi:hypothetical protein